MKITPLASERCFGLEYALSTLKSRLFSAIFIASVSAAAASTSATDLTDEAGFESLFDGKTLGGWDGNPDLWSVADGAILGATSDESPIAANEFLIWDGDATNFVLRLQFRIADRGVGNSGIQYRSKRKTNAQGWGVQGYQADIERTNKHMGILYEEGGRGILARRGEQVVVEEAPAGFKKRVVGSQDLRFDPANNEFVDHPLANRFRARAVREPWRI